MSFADYVRAAYPSALVTPHARERGREYFARVLAARHFADVYGAKRRGPFAVVRRALASESLLFWDDDHAVWTTAPECAAVYGNQTVAASVAYVVGGFLRSLVGGCG